MSERAMTAEDIRALDKVFRRRPPLSGRPPLRAKESERVAFYREDSSKMRYEAHRLEGLLREKEMAHQQLVRSTQILEAKVRALEIEKANDWNDVAERVKHHYLGVVSKASRERNEAVNERIALTRQLARERAERDVEQSMTNNPNTPNTRQDSDA